MSDSIPLDEVRIIASRIAALLDEPQFGLATWHDMLATNLRKMHGLTSAALIAPHSDSPLVPDEQGACLAPPCLGQPTCRLRKTLAGFQLELDAKKAEVERLRPSVPEWRPLSVLTREVVDRHKGAWAFMPENKHLPELAYLMVEYVNQKTRELGVIYPSADDGVIPSYFKDCRPVDREGVPVPWLEVGL